MSDTSDTPRTDAVTIYTVTSARFARELERELNAAKATLRQVKASIAGTSGDVKLKEIAPAVVAVINHALEK